MSIGEELQMAVQRSTKFGTLISGLFESGKSPETDDSALITNESSNVAQIAEQVAEEKGISDDTSGHDITSPDDVASHDLKSSSFAKTHEQRHANSDDGNDSGAIAASEEVALIESAKEDPAAFGALYERYVDRVYAYIYHRVSNTQEAEDLTARTFYRALSRLHTYEDRGYPFSAWLFRIAHNLVANWHRDRSRRRFLSLDRIWSHSHEGDTPEHVVEEAERSNALWDAIDRLPKDRRDLIFYKFGSRLSNLEIGEMMNKSESAIKSLYFRTLAALRSDLEKDDL